MSCGHSTCPAASLTPFAIRPPWNLTTAWNFIIPPLGHLPPELGYLDRSVDMLHDQSMGRLAAPQTTLLFQAALHPGAPTSNLIKHDTQSYPPDHRTYSLAVKHTLSPCSMVYGQLPWFYGHRACSKLVWVDLCLI